MKIKSFQSFNYALAVLAATLVFVSGAKAASNFEVLHEFLDRPGMNPSAALVADSAGNLYGTTRFSVGQNCDEGCGVVFELARSGGHWTYNIIHRFSGTDGAEPFAALIVDSAGNLYGTTETGGANGMGTVYEVSPSGTNWKEKVLHSFGGSDHLSYPNSGLTMDASGNLYGTALYTGARAQGGVFELKPSGGRWQETIIYNFSRDAGGFGPSGGTLVWDSAGNLYGVTNSGGAHKQGVVFRLTPSSGGNWTEAVLYSFLNPSGNGVTFDSAGNLYGTTVDGGLTSCNPPYGCGGVFELSPSGSGWTFHMLHRFNGSDGWFAYYGVTVDSAGNLYGATYYGGAYGGGDYGLVFKLSRSGGIWMETVLHSFGRSDGANPSGGLIFGPEGALYGVRSMEARSTAWCLVLCRSTVVSRTKVRLGRDR
jgi:uncharacterized repeat protein (TIGR03803 family)